MDDTQRTRRPDLELAEDLDLQRRTWMAERIGWLLIVLIVAAAVFGLFGRGLLDTAVAGEHGGSLWAEYHRFWRARSPMVLRIHLNPEPATSTVRVWLTRSYLESVTVAHVLPQPESVEAGADRITYVFALAPGPLPTAVTFSLEPVSPGLVEAEVGLETGAAVGFSQFIYP